jgi:signal transduction histidine kinase
MASAVSGVETRSESLSDTRPAQVFHWVVSAITVCGLSALLLRTPGVLQIPELTAWILVSLLTDLMYVRIGKSITLSMSLPVLLAAAFIHTPEVTGLIAFLGCLDPRELQGKSSIERVLFNRSQIALAAGSASFAMRLFQHDGLAWEGIVAIFLLGLTVDCVVNVAFVITSTVVSGRASTVEALVEICGAEPVASLGLYASMALVAPLLLLIYRDWGPWALLACTALLFPFRIALTKIESLGVTAHIVRVREAALADAEATASANRREERRLLAGDLHDEVLPALFKVHLMGEVLKQDLASGRLLDLDDDLPDLLRATHAAQEAVRRVVGDLRTSRSAIRNVSRAIRSCAEQLEDEGAPRLDLRLADLRACEEASLVLLQVAREAMVNASRYSGAAHIRVELTEATHGWAELTISDDGSGFLLEAVDKESHFGLQLMRERVESINGLLDIASSPGVGTVVIAQVPLMKVGEGRHETTPPATRGG